MRISLSLLYLLFGFHLIAQTNSPATHLVILGRHQISETPIGFRISVTITEDPSKCDPVKGFIPLEDNIKHYKESLTANGIDDEAIEELPNYQTNRFRKKQYLIQAKDIDQAYQIINISRRMDFVVDDVRNVYMERSYADQDIHAIAALHNAQKKANVIASYLGMKVKGIVNIDDDTRIKSIYDKSKPRSLGRDSKLDELLALLDLDLLQYGGSAYLLRVTFELY